MNWINTVGGPFVLLERYALGEWSGVDHANAQNDYVRACEVSDYLGRLQLRSVEALVLNDEPMQTTYVSRDSSSGVFVRWMFANSELGVERFITKSDAPIGNAVMQFDVPKGDLLLFDATIPGAQVGGHESLSVQLDPGRYIIYQFMFTPDDETCFLLHDFRRA